MVKNVNAALKKQRRSSEPQGSYSKYILYIHIFYESWGQTTLNLVDISQVKVAN